MMLASNGLPHVQPFHEIGQKCLFNGVCPAVGEDEFGCRPYQVFPLPLTVGQKNPACRADISLCGPQSFQIPGELVAVLTDGFPASCSERKAMISNEGSFPVIDLTVRECQRGQNDCMWADGFSFLFPLNVGGCRSGSEICGRCYASLRNAEHVRQKSRHVIIDNAIDVDAAHNPGNAKIAQFTSQMAMRQQGWVAAIAFGNCERGNVSSGKISVRIRVFDHEPNRVRCPRRHLQRPLFGWFIRFDNRVTRRGRKSRHRHLGGQRLHRNCLRLSLSAAHQAPGEEGQSGNDNPFHRRSPVHQLQICIKPGGLAKVEGAAL